MEALIFSANAVLPIIFLIVLGYCLKRIGMLSKAFLDVGNRLTFRVLLPVMLFLNVYGIGRLQSVNAAFIVYGIGGVLVIFALAVLVCCAFTKDAAKRGALVQGVFRSNYAIIGIPLAASLYGGDGAAAAGIMSAFCVPVFNILGVIALTVFAPQENQHRLHDLNIRKMLRGIVTNPLIIGTVSGIAVLGIREVFGALGIGFRLSDLKPLYSAAESVRSLCTPFALIVLGGRFEFSAAANLRREIIFGTALRTVAVPLLGLMGASLLRGPLGLTGAHFAVYVGVFATPVAVASAIMAKEMGSDGELAGQLVIWTSLVSTVTVFLCVTVLRAAGLLS